MLNALACAGMELGTRRVTIAALAELHQLETSNNRAVEKKQTE
jgi:hypothetical protein